MAAGGPEQPTRPMRGAGQPMGHLDLSFPMFWGHTALVPRTLSLHARAAKSFKNEVRLTSPVWLKGGIRAQGGNL